MKTQDKISEGVVKSIGTLRAERANVRSSSTCSDQTVMDYVKKYKVAIAVLFVWIFFTGSRYIGAHLFDGRGAGAEGGGSAASRAVGGAAGRNVPVVAPQVGLRSSAIKILYAPDNNLEAADLQMIGEARYSIDAALYSLTDKPLCRALASAAERGVRVRLYRDGGQYAEEQRDGRDSVCDADLVAAGVEVRVKPEDSELMHLKSYVIDGRLLRTGSANISYSGEHDQDNDAVYIDSPEAVRAFERDFAEMWARSGNITIVRTIR